MANYSIKICLNDWPDFARIEKHLAVTLGALPETSAETETDEIYNIYTSAGQDLYIKYRHERTQSLVILERLASADVHPAPLRHSRILGLHPRTYQTDSTIHEILGGPDRLIRKTRQVYRTPQYSSLSIYVDIYRSDNSTSYYLELQWREDETKNIDAVKRKTDSVVLQLGMQHLPTTTMPYAEISGLEKLALPNTFSALARLPDSILDRITREPFFEPKKSLTLLRKGEPGDVAYLIRTGTARTDCGKVLRAGQLLGEFGILEGTRSADVIVSEDFKATILSRTLVQEVMMFPCFSQKYLLWKIEKSEKERSLAKLPHAC